MRGASPRPRAFSGRSLSFMVASLSDFAWRNRMSRLMDPFPRVGLLSGSCGLIAGPRRPLERCRNESIQTERAADEFQNADFFQHDARVGECDFQRQPIGGFPQMLGQRIADQSQHSIEAFVLIEYRGAFLRGGEQTVLVEIAED